MVARGPHPWLYLLQCGNTAMWQWAHRVLKSWVEGDVKGHGVTRPWRAAASQSGQFWPMMIQFSRRQLQFICCSVKCMPRPIWAVVSSHEWAGADALLLYIQIDIKILQCFPVDAKHTQTDKNGSDDGNWLGCWKFSHLFIEGFVQASTGKVYIHIRL